MCSWKIIFKLPEKRCPDCIRKHLLKAEAFAEEAIALDKTGKYLQLLRPIPAQIREIQDEFSNGADDHRLGQKARVIRKRLSPLCFSVNTKRQKTSSQRVISIPKQVAENLWPTRRHLLGFKYLVLAIKKHNRKMVSPLCFQHLE